MRFKQIKWLSEKKKTCFIAEEEKCWIPDQLDVNKDKKARKQTAPIWKEVQSICSSLNWRIWGKVIFMFWRRRAWEQTRQTLVQFWSLTVLLLQREHHNYKNNPSDYIWHSCLQQTPSCQVKCFLENLLLRCRFQAPLSKASFREWYSLHLMFMFNFISFNICRTKARKSCAFRRSMSETIGQVQCYRAASLTVNSTIKHYKLYETQKKRKKDCTSPFCTLSYIFTYLILSYSFSLLLFSLNLNST